MNKKMKPYLYFTAAFFLLLFLIFPSFETIDDSIMLQIVSGQYGHAQSEFMLYSSVFYGKLLVFLYKLLPVFNWYFFIFIISHLASWLVVLKISLKNSTHEKFALTLFTISFITFGLYFLGNLQFTTTSFLLGFSGILLILNSENKKFIIAGVLMLLLATLIRFYSVLLLSWLVLPYLFYRWVLKDGFKGILKYKSQIALFIILAITAFVIRETGRNQYLKDDNAKLLGEFIIERGKLIDNPNFIYSKENKKVFDKVGWSEMDFKMFFDYYMDPKDPFTPENLKYIHSNLHLKRLDSDRIKNGILKIFSQYQVYLMMFFIIFGFFIKRKLNRIDIIYVLMQSAAIIIFLLYLVLFNDFKPRVIIIIFYLATIFSCFYILKNINVLKTKRFKLQLYIPLIIVGLMDASINTYATIERLNKHEQLMQQLGVINKIDKDWLVIHGYDLPVEHEILKLINNKPLLEGKVYFTMPAFLNHYLTGSKFKQEQKSIFELLGSNEETVLLLHNETILTIDEITEYISQKQNVSKTKYIRVEQTNLYLKKKQTQNKFPSLNGNNKNTSKARTK